MNGNYSDYDNELFVSIYDYDNPNGPDHDFYRKLADDNNAKSIVDLGCGTGIFTTTLVSQERNIVGIDPSHAMLEIAKNRLNGRKVTWIEGTGDKIPINFADFIFMTGNVAMHIIGNDWYETLQHIVKGLKEGGMLAFETRNPKAKAWKEWHQENEVRDTPAGKLCENTIIDSPDENGVLTMHIHNEFLNHNQKVYVKQKLQFRSYEQVVKDLEYAGLKVLACYCNWSCVPFMEISDEKLMIFVAMKK